MKKAVNSKRWIFNLILMIIILSGFVFLGYLNYNVKKIISEQTGMITEQKIKIQNLEGKLGELDNKEIEILSKLNSIQSMSNLSRMEKQCELSGLKILKAEYLEGKIDLKIENSNNIDIEGFNIKAYSGQNIVLNSKIDGVEAFKSKDYVLNSEKPDEIVIVPKIILEGDSHVCNKEVRSKVSELVNINGKFNVTSFLIVNGVTTNVNIMMDIIQTGTELSGSASARKKDGSYGQPFDISGSINDKIINLDAKNVELPSGSIEGINSDLIIDIILEGVVVDNNKLEGSDIGDVVVKVKDFPAPGVSVSIEGIFAGERL